MERVLTVEVNLNLKADESLQQIVACIFGQKLTADNERNPQPATEQPNPEPQPAVEQPAVEQPAETEAKPKRTRSKKTDPAPATDPQPAETEQPAADPEPEPQPQPDPQPAESVSLKEVKQVFFQKLAEHRDEIRSKINELGAPSLSTIEAAKLPEMLNFLKSLD